MREFTAHESRVIALALAHSRGDGGFTLEEYKTVLREMSVAMTIGTCCGLVLKMLGEVT